MINILITGGAGNIGGSLSAKLVENKNYFVVILDNLSTGSKLKLPSQNYNNWIFIKGDVNDINDISTIMISYKFDYVFHYAAVVGVKRTIDNPKLVLNDIKGIENILNLSKNIGVKRVFFSSSSEVYGEPVEIPQHEKTTPLNSKLPYAIVKNVGEAFLRSYNKEYGLAYTIFRFFNTYGPNQSKDFVVSKFLYQALNNDQITIYGDGLQTRTFCYIDDNIDTTIKIMENNFCINDVINIGSDQEITILDLAKLIIQITNSKSIIKHYPPLEEGDMTRRMPNNELMKKILDRPLIPLRNGLTKTFKSLIN